MARDVKKMAGSALRFVNGERRVVEHTVTKWRRIGCRHISLAILEDAILPRITQAIRCEENIGLRTYITTLLSRYGEHWLVGGGCCLQMSLTRHCHITITFMALLIYGHMFIMANSMLPRQHCFVNHYIDWSRYEPVGERVVTVSRHRRQHQGEDTPRRSILPVACLRDSVVGRW